MREKDVIRLNVGIADRVSSIPLPKKIHAQLDALLTLQIYKCPITPKAGHVVEVMGSHRQLPISNKEGVGSVPLPFSQGLHQNGASRSLWQQAAD